MIKDWTYYGLYGDREYTVRVTVQPDDLPKYAKAALLKYKFEGEIHYTKDGCSSDMFMKNQYKTWRKLEAVGLARERGNAWNKRIVWARGMKAWIKKQQIQAYIDA